MKVTIEYLEYCFAQTGFDPVTLEKVIRLGEIAKEIAGHPLLGESLALKGGTAINLGRGSSPPRLSVDLDYNYIRHTERKLMLEERPEIERAVAELLARMEFHPQWLKGDDPHAGRSLSAQYRSALGGMNNVKLDLIYMWRTPLNGVIEKQLWQPGELVRPSVITVSDEELWMGKVLAYLDRVTPRDAWDIIRFPKDAREIYDSRLFRRLLIAMSAKLPRSLGEYGRARHERILTQVRIDSELVPMLSSTVGIDAGKLVDQSWKLIEPFLALKDKEAEYLEKAMQGEIDAGLIFPAEPDMVELISSHPEILWKVQKVKQKG